MPPAPVKVTRLPLGSSVFSRLSHYPVKVWEGNLFEPLIFPDSSQMCRNIKVLYNFDPPATVEDIQAASLQYVRKISGFNKPSKANEGPFQTAVNEVSRVSTRLLHSLKTTAPRRNREAEIAKRKVRAAKRFGT